MALAAAACGSTVGGLVFPSMARMLLPSIGFGWTMRAIGFLQLGTLSIALSVVRTREMPRKKGPLVDLAAFGEPEYTLYATGAFLVRKTVLVFVWMALADFDLVDIHWRLLPILLPCPICPRYTTPFLHQFSESLVGPEWGWHNCAPLPRFPGPFDRHIQHFCHLGRCHFPHDLLLGRSFVPAGSVCLDCLLQLVNGRHSVPVSRSASSLEIRSTETGHANGNGVCHHRLGSAHRATDFRAIGEQQWWELPEFADVLGILHGCWLNAPDNRKGGQEKERGLEVLCQDVALSHSSCVQTELRS